MADQASGLNGKWIKILEVRNYGPDADVTSDDLNAALRNFRASGDGIPVGEGQNNRLVKDHARIDQLRRVGDTLEGRIVDPSLGLEHYYAAGGHELTQVALDRGANGLSIARVGLDNTRRLKILEPLKPRLDAFGNIEITFSERGDSMDPIARKIAEMKAAGHWHPLFDELGAREAFHALENVEPVLLGEGMSQKIALPETIFAECLKQVSIQLNNTPSGRDAGLHEAAERIRDARGVTYCEALTMASRDRETARDNVYFSEGAGADFPGAALHLETQKLQAAEGISYGEALARVANQRPELTRRR